MTQKNNPATPEQTLPRTQLRQLKVNQETIRDLSDTEAANIHGGQRHRASDDGGCTFAVGCHPDPTNV